MKSNKLAEIQTNCRNTEQAYIQQLSIRLEKALEYVNQLEIENKRMDNLIKYKDTKIADAIENTQMQTENKWSGSKHSATSETISNYQKKIKELEEENKKLKNTTGLKDEIVLLKATLVEKDKIINKQKIEIESYQIEKNTTILNNDQNEETLLPGKSIAMDPFDESILMTTIQNPIKKRKTGVNKIKVNQLFSDVDSIECKPIEIKKETPKPKINLSKKKTQAAKRKTKASKNDTKIEFTLNPVKKQTKPAINKDTTKVEFPC